MDGCLNRLWKEASADIAHDIKGRNELFPAVFGQVEIDHGGLNLGVSEQLLDGVYVCSYIK